MATAAQKRARQQKVDALLASAAVYAAKTGLATAASAGGGALLGAASAGAGGAAATGAVAGLMTAGGASLTVPVAGWIVGGALLTAAAVTAITLAVRKKNRRQAEAIAATYGEQGKVFIREYFALMKKSPAYVAGRVVDLEADVAKLSPRRSDKKRERLTDKLNAARMVLLCQVAQPAEPMAADEPSSSPVRLRPAQYTPQLRVQAGLRADDTASPVSVQLEDALPVSPPVAAAAAVAFVTALWGVL